MIGVDIGNTLTKVYNLDTDTPTLIYTVKTGNIPSIPHSDNILIASVNSNATDIWLKHFPHATLITRDSPWKFKISPEVYTQTVGIDRLLAIEGAILLGIYTALIVMLGTATVINVVSNGTFLGGAISPGIDTMYSALAQKAPVIKKFNLKKGKLIGKTTEEALYSGICYMQALWIDKYNSCVGNLPIIYTGGAFHHIKEIAPSGQYIPSLIALGMKSLQSHI